MALAPGTRIGVFEVTGALGAGGMGEVYRARDTRLDREVAIKVLPASFASDPDRLMRFEREAKTLATLNHPHIAQIYGLEQSGDTSALVMELVAGEDLTARIARGPIQLDEALPIARQIADALEAAHEAGIIHRDLKPANIKLRADGTVKVLDFGLAKALDARAIGAAGAAGDGVTGVLANSPTITSPAVTAHGSILGTAAYMSPEQAKGRPVDRRADIWAFGCVLFEMLTGRTLFAAETVTETLARVIEREPDLSALPAATPPAVRTLLARCLERDTRQRLRDIGEARVALQRPLTAVSPPETGASGPRYRTVAVLILASAVVAAAAAAWVIGATASAPEPAERRFTIESPGRAPAVAASISPDGGAVLVIAAGKLWLQRLDRFVAIEVPGSEDARAPFWAPDSAAFGFEARGQLWRVSRDGGAPVRIGAVPEFGFSSSVAWLRDGRLVFTTGGSTLLQMPVTGGEATPLFSLDTTKELDIHDVSATPDGQSVLYVVHSVGGPWTIEWFSIADASRRTLDIAPGSSFLSTPVYSSTGHLLFERQAGIWAVPLSRRDRQPAGEPFIVAADARLPSLAADGTMVMLPGATEPDAGLGWIDRTGRVVRMISEPRGTLVDPRLSPDGRLAIATRDALNDSDLWIYDLERGSERRLTFETGPDSSPTWSPDGQYIVYRCSGTICARRADGSGPRVELLDGPASSPSLSPDGQRLAFVREVRPGDSDILVVELSPGGLGQRVAAQPRVLISAPRFQMAPQVSPDGRFIAYSSMEDGRLSTYVAPFPSGDGKWELPFSGANMNPRWGGKSDRISVMDERARIVEFPVDRTHGLEIAAALTPIPSRSAYGAGYDRSADGAQFLVPVVSTATSDAGRLLVVQNWRPPAPE
jgi:eukaryotic-like serine/threonine-protein kinase